MRRRPMFYVFNMILPCFLITTVAFLGFCVPSDSGEWTEMRCGFFCEVDRFLRGKSFHWRDDPALDDRLSDVGD